MKITFLSPRNDLSGNRKHITMLAKELSGRHSVDILYPVIPDLAYMRYFRQDISRMRWLRTVLVAIKNYYQEPSWKYDFLLKNDVTVKPYWGYVSERLLQERDVAIYFSPYQALELTKRRVCHNARIYYLMHDHARTDAYIVSPRLIKETYFNGDPVVALSQRTRSDLMEYGVQCDVVIPAGVDTSVFYPKPLTATHQAKVLFYYWPGEPRKGSDLLTEVLKTIRGRYPQVEISLLTPGGIEVPPYTTFGNLDEKSLAELYRTHDIFVFSSRYEGFGLPPLEAMACGCGVISTRVGATEEFIKHGESGWLCEPEVGKLIQAIEELLKNRALLTRLRTEAVLQAKKWSWGNAAQKLEHFLQKIVDNTGW